MLTNSFQITLFWICLAICAGVLIATLYLTSMHRKSISAPQPFHRSLIIEIIWTTIPFLILAILILPAVFIV